MGSASVLICGGACSYSAHFRSFIVSISLIVLEWHQYQGQTGHCGDGGSWKVAETGE